MDKRSMHGVWSSRWTFILAATGSAVGLGNIWKFPYITGENGGGAFVLVYLLCIALVGIPIMMGEVLIGRRGRMSPVNAMAYVAEEAGLSRSWSVVGWMGVCAGLMILAFYSVVAGWAISYTLSSANGDFANVSGQQAGGIFAELLRDPAKLTLWHSVFIVMTLVVVASGVTKGLGAVARVLMPLLFVMLGVLFFYGFYNGDFAKGFAFLFDFKFDKLTWSGVLKALGHAFFTLSLGMGSIMAYGAYIPGGASLTRTVITVGFLDTFVALVAGLAIFPIVFASPGLEPGAGPGLMFVSLPVAFGGMPFGGLFGTLFFVLVTIAAWSSAVSLIEPGVAWLTETGKCNRLVSTILLSIVAWMGGMACIFSNNWLEEKQGGVFSFAFEALDFLTSQVMLPLGGFLIAIFVGWLMRRAIVQAELDAEGHPMFDLWLFVVRWVSPILVLAVLVIGLKDKLF